jgi:hypothetical protein
LVAFAARLGENFDDSKLREAFITTDFVEAETKRQEELQIKVNFSPMLPKLFCTYPHREEDCYGISIFVTDIVKSFLQLIKYLCQLDFFTKSLTILFVLIYSELRCCECSRKEVIFWFCCGKSRIICD